MVIISLHLWQISIFNYLGYIVSREYGTLEQRDGTGGIKDIFYLIQVIFIKRVTILSSPYYPDY